MTETHPHDLLPAYSLGCLDDVEQLQVCRHLQNCEACRTDLAGLEAINAALAAAVPLQSPEGTLKIRVLESCRPQTRITWFNALLSSWPRLVPAVAICSVVLAVLLGVANLIYFLSPASQDKAGSLAQLKVISLKGVQSTATGQLLVNPVSREGLLIVNSLSPLGKELQYQLWLIRDGKRFNGGVFSVDQSGTANIQISSAEPFAAYDSFGVTIEPYGGSPGPTGNKVLGGKLIL